MPHTTSLLSSLTLMLLLPAFAQADVEAVREKARQYEQQIKDVKDSTPGLKLKMETFQAQIKQKTEELKALGKDFDSLTAEAKRRAELAKSGEEEKQLEALKGAEGLGNEGLLLLAFTAKDSPHEKVRRMAIDLAVELGENGFPAIAHAYESLPGKDRVYLVEQLGKRKTDNLLPLLAIGREADPELRKALAKVAVRMDEGLVIVGLLAKDADDQFVAEMIDMAAEVKGENTTLLLFAAAKSGNPSHAVAALKAAADRGQEGLVVLAAAYETKDAKVRGELVRAAKKIGGDVAQFVIDHALKDEDQELRQAAEEALK